EHIDDFLRCGHALARLHHRGLVLLADDVHAKFDAFVADEHRGTGDQLAHFVLALAAERAVERVLGISAAAVADLAHLPVLSSPSTGAPISRRIPMSPGNPPLPPRRAPATCSVRQTNTKTR